MAFHALDRAVYALALPHHLPLLDGNIARGGEYVLDIPQAIFEDDFIRQILRGTCGRDHHLEHGAALEDVRQHVGQIGIGVKDGILREESHIHIGELAVEPDLDRQGRRYLEVGQILEILQAE